VSTTDHFGALVEYDFWPAEERRRLEGATDANTRADAIDAAIRHYLEDKENRQKHWREFTPEQLQLLNTSALTVSYYPKVK